MGIRLLLRKHKKAIINVVITICVLAVVCLLAYFLIPWRGEIYEFDLIRGYKVYISEVYVYDSDTNAGEYNVWQVDDATAKQIVKLCRTAKNSYLTTAELSGKLQGRKDGFSYEEYVEKLSDVQNSGLETNNPRIFIKAGDYGYKIEIGMYDTEVGYFPVFAIKRERVGSRSGTEMIGYMLQSGSGKLTSLMPTDEMYEIVDVVFGYDGTGGELIAENTNNWRLQNFG